LAFTGFNCQGFYRILDLSLISHFKQVPTMKFLSRRLAGALFSLGLLQCSTVAWAEIIIPDNPLLGELLGLGVVTEDLVPGQIITDVDTVEAQVQPLTSTLSAHLRSVFWSFSLPPLGGGAGDDEPYQGVWFSSNGTDFENTFSRTEFEGTSDLRMLGYDLGIFENHLVGIAIGTETTEIDTAFNDGSLDTEGNTVAAYYGWLISDHWSLDVNLGRSGLDTEQLRTPPPLAPSVEIVNSEYSTERAFASANFNSFWTLWRLNLGGRVGYLTTRQEQDAYIESDLTAVEASILEYEQAYIAGDVAYGQRSQPYLGVTLMKDLNSELLVFPSGEQPANDEESLQLAAGWRYYGENGLSVILEWNKRDGKDEYLEDSISFTLRFDAQ
jgi:hypothetical protein